MTAITGLSGCNTDTPPNTTETTRQSESQISAEQSRETIWTSQNEQSNITQTTEYKLNNTDYAVTWPFAPNGAVGQSYESPLGDTETAAALLGSSPEAMQFLAAVESATGVSPSEFQFVTTTDFSTASIVVVQRSVSSGASRLRLQSVDAVRTTAPQMKLREVNPGPTQAAPTRLLLVRLPNEGTPPDMVTVRVIGVDGETTVTADSYD